MSTYRRFKRISALCLACLALLVRGLSACSVSHEGAEGSQGPQGGTETGNPPIIMDKLIALVVQSDAVHLTGAAGAVTPGGSKIEVVSSFSGETFQATAAADGSFDVAVTTAPLDTFELRAVTGTKSSNAVYVARGAAAVSSGPGDTLTCDQRTQLAQTQLVAIAESADKSCSTSADCLTVWAGSTCTGGCPNYLMSKQGESQIEMARSVIEGGLCKNFEADGCHALIPPCVPAIQNIVCVSGTCMHGSSMGLMTGPECSADFAAGVGAQNTTVYWFSPAAQACLERSYTGSGGNTNRYASLAECEAACNPGSLSCPQGRVEQSVCVSGGLAGGCARRDTACAKACTPSSGASECQGDPIGPWCANGFCDATSPE